MIGGRPAQASAAAGPASDSHERGGFTDDASGGTLPAQADDRKLASGFSPGGRRAPLRLAARLSPLLLAGLIVDTIAVLGCAIDAARLGKGMDVNWDLLNYHYYYSYLLFHGGIGQADPEPFTARYLNPVGELPWYLLDRSFSPRMCAALLGVLVGLNLPLVRRITLRILPTGLSEVRAFSLSAAAVLVAAVGAVFRMEVGTSMNDTVVSLPMLAALLLVLRAAQQGRSSRPLLFALAGVLSGLALAAKLTMACYVLALVLSVGLVAVHQRRLAPMLAHLGGAAIGLAVAAGWWFLSLWRLTGNPVFPFYNSIFHSTDWSSGDLTDTRYGPHGLVDAAKFPLYMWEGTHRLVDVYLRDPRWLVLVVLAAATLVVLIWRRALRRTVRATVVAPALSAFLLFFVVGSVLWLFQFGIARYASTSELLTGPIFALLLLVVLRQAYVAATVAVAAALCMAPFVRGEFAHLPFKAQRFMVQAGPLEQVPRGSVVVADAGTAPSSFLLTYLPPGVKRHVVHPWFYGSPVLRKLERDQFATALHIYVLENWTVLTSTQVADRVRHAMNLQLEPKSCVAIRFTGQRYLTRYLCKALWVGDEEPAARAKGTRP